MENEHPQKLEYIHRQGVTPFDIEYFCYQTRWATNLKQALDLFQGDAIIRLVPDNPNEILVLE